jgi:hypothetical protein
MAKASPLGNLNFERVSVQIPGTTADFKEAVNAQGEVHPAPGPTSRADIELRKAGLSDVPKSEYTGGATS